MRCRQPAPDTSCVVFGWERDEYFRAGTCAVNRGRTTEGQRTKDGQGRGLLSDRSIGWSPRLIGYPAAAMVFAPRRMHRLVGRSQVVRQRILIPPFGGSSPPAPANI